MAQYNTILTDKAKYILFIFFGLFIFSSSVDAQEQKELVILHLNDTHSRIEPFPENDSRNANKAGVVRQEALIEEVRTENKNVLLFHCGDYVQGTPYFNMFRGEAEIAFMNLMKFDAACIGNHEFDFGLEGLAEMIKQADFPVLATNLDFSNTCVAGLTQDYHIIEKDGIKIGLFGLTVDPEGLVAKQNYEGMIFRDPLETANKMAKFLKKKKKCNLVICLSHLGYFPNEDEFGDITLAKKSQNIDIILGGHSHTFLRMPDRRQNLDGKEVIINQMGGYGIYVGRLDVVLEKTKK